MWPSSSLLQKLRVCYTARREEMPERLSKHADGALAVLTKRLELARKRKYGVTPEGRLRWVRRVRRGNMRAAAEGRHGYRGGCTARGGPGSGLCRGALRLGILRKAPQRASSRTDGGRAEELASNGSCAGQENRARKAEQVA